jgi:hypothetical protein
MTRHCRSPSTCSVCLGAPARTVHILDGEHVRANDEPVSAQAESARRRGQKLGGLANARKSRP